MKLLLQKIVSAVDLMVGSSSVAIGADYPTRPITFIGHASRHSESFRRQPCAMWGEGEALGECRANFP